MNNPNIAIEFCEKCRKQNVSDDECSHILNTIFGGGFVNPIKLSPEFVIKLRTQYNDAQTRFDEIMGTE